MATLETPARIMRRIEEASLVEMPSLPSFPMNESDDGPGDPMYALATPSESEQHERSITSFPTDPTESEEPATRVTSTPLVTSAFRNSGSRFISGGSRGISGSQSRFINSLHTTLLPNGLRRDSSFKASPIESSVASTIKPGESKPSYGSMREVENGRGLEVAEESNFSVGVPIEEDETEESAIRNNEPAEESVKSDELHEAQESFVSTAPPNLPEYEEYQVSVHSAPMPSPKDPMKNISMRRRSSPHVAKRPVPVLSDSSFSTISEEEASKPQQTAPKMPEYADLSRDITLPQETPRGVRDTSHMKRAFSSSPAAVAEESDQTKSASISKLPPLPASSPMNSHFTTIASVPQTPMAAGPNSGTSRRASYVLSVLSSTKPRVKATPHPYRAPIRRTPHPLIRVPLERRASFATVTTSTPSTNNDLTTNLKANTSFDPAIGETRFNVAKMNGYLHKLNEKLVEENLGLHLALKEYEGSSSSHSIAPALELAQAEEWQHVVASLREELDAANAKRERLADEVRRLTANAGRKEMEWDAKLREELDAANATRERLEDEVRRLTANAGRKEMEWDAKLREELDAANATRERLEDEVRRLTANAGRKEMEWDAKLRSLERELTPGAINKSIHALKLFANPGSPLKELSWMQNSTLSVAQIAPLLSEIQRLRDEVAVKEQKVDDELDGLQDAFGRNNNVLRRLQEEIDRREKLQVEVNEFTRREHMERAEREALTERHRVELDNMAEELQAASQEKQRLHEDRIEVQRMIRDLERDLQRLRREADRFGHDLSDLQAEKARVEAKRSEEKALSERQRQRSATEVRLVKEQLSAAQTEARTEIEQLRIQHKKECKGLIVQIHYLKDLYRRETVFRMDLAYQKSYLQAALARQPYLLPQAPRIERPISLRGAAQAVIFISRIKHSSDQWRSQRAHRPSMYAALEDARRRRTSS